MYKCHEQEELHMSINIILHTNHTLFQTKWPKYPISDQNGSKTTPFGTAHVYIAHTIGVPPPWSLLCTFAVLPTVTVKLSSH